MKEAQSALRAALKPAPEPEPKPETPAVRQLTKRTIKRGEITLHPH